MSAFLQRRLSRAALQIRGGCRHIAQHFAQQIRAKLCSWLNNFTNTTKWTPAGDLADGTRLLSHDGQEPMFEGLEDSGCFETVYNLEHVYSANESVFSA